MSVLLTASGCGGGDGSSGTVRLGDDAGNLGAIDAGMDLDAGAARENDGDAGNVRYFDTDFSSLLGPNVCPLIDVNHLLSIYRTPLDVKNEPIYCVFGPQDTDFDCYYATIVMYHEDDDALGDDALWPDYAPTNGDPATAYDHALSGVGDSAFWWNENGHGIPWLVARKGKAVCLVETGSSEAASVFNLTFTGTPLDIKVADADGEAFARMLGDLCNDLFQNYP